MKKNLLFLILLWSSQLWAQQPISVIPLPQNITAKTGNFPLNQSVSVQIAPKFESQITNLYSYLNLPKTRMATPYRVEVIDNPALGKEAYELTVSAKKIQLQASTEQGVFYGIVTLKQLIENKGTERFIPCVEIKDAPEFSYRGMMLDVSRHFFPMSFLKKYVDILALYKFNTLHIHLTDGAGWRVEIKKYPILTQKAAWREGKTWKEWHALGEPISEMGNPNAIGGFYTQQELKDLVKYAQNKGITILPEIELPGHSDEVLKVMPELGCVVNEKNLGGDFCPSNPKTLAFLKDIIDEIITIFPSEYIHIGGDEATKRFWNVCPRCQKYMKDQHLTDIDQLQSELIKKVEKYIISKKRKMIGWDEILQGGLAPEATVMSWRGEQGGIDAAKQHHHVIMTPGNYLYFDKYQQKPSTQPEAIGGYLTVPQVYSYYPIPKELKKEEQQYILGAQANLWAEYIPTTEHVEYMTFPRALALAEVNWTAPEKKKWSDFQTRLQKQYGILQELQVNYARPSYQIEIQPKFDYEHHEVNVHLAGSQYKMPIYYTTDGSEPSVKNGQLFTQDFMMKNSGVVKAANIALGDSTSRIKADSLEIDFHKAIAKKVIYNQAYSKNYVAQKEMTLVNGYRGGTSYADGQWQGFETNGFDVTIDLEKEIPLSSLQLDFMQQNSVGIYLPSDVEVLVSNDGKAFKSVGKQTHDISPQESGLLLKTFKFGFQETARYVRIKATDKQRGYLFCDEVIVY